jgi:hypothetical protein
MSQVIKQHEAGSRQSSAYSLTSKIEAAYSSETSFTFNGLHGVISQKKRHFRKSFLLYEIRSHVYEKIANISGRVTYFSVAIRFRKNMSHGIGLQYVLSRVMPFRIGTRKCNLFISGENLESTQRKQYEVGEIYIRRNFKICTFHQI